MMRKKISIVSLIGIMALATMLSTQAHARYCQGNNCRQDGSRWTQNLNLTEEQTQQFQTIHAKYKANKDQNQETQTALKEELKTLVQSSEKGDAIKEKIRVKFDEMQALQDKNRDNHLEMMLEVREILTPEQLANFEGIWEKGRRGKGKGRGMGRNQRANN